MPRGRALLLLRCGSNVWPVVSLCGTAPVGQHGREQQVTEEDQKENHREHAVNRSVLMVMLFAFRGGGSPCLSCLKCLERLARARSRSALVRSA